MNNVQITRKRLQQQFDALPQAVRRRMSGAHWPITSQSGRVVRTTVASADAQWSIDDTTLLGAWEGQAKATLTEAATGHRLLDAAQAAGLDVTRVTRAKVRTLGTQWVASHHISSRPAFALGASEAEVLKTLAA